MNGTAQTQHTDSFIQANGAQGAPYTRIYAALY
jgi:hypothetical protein